MPSAYMEKLVPDQNEYFSANPLIPADSQKFANVRNWFRTVQIAADQGFQNKIRSKYDPSVRNCQKM